MFRNPGSKHGKMALLALENPPFPPFFDDSLQVCAGLIGPVERVGPIGRIEVIRPILRIGRHSDDAVPSFPAGLRVRVRILPNAAATNARFQPRPIANMRAAILKRSSMPARPSPSLIFGASSRTSCRMGNSVSGASRLGIPLDEIRDVRSRIVAYRPLGWQRADHAGLAAEEIGRAAERGHARHPIASEIAAQPSRRGGARASRPRVKS